jgi:hypothetical protein
MILGPGYVQDLLAIDSPATDVYQCIKAAQNKATTRPSPPARALSTTTLASATHDKNAYLDPKQAASDILEIGGRRNLEPGWPEIYDEFGKVLNAANRPVNQNGWSAKDWKTFSDNLPAGQNNKIVIDLLRLRGIDPEERGQKVNQQIESALRTLQVEQRAASIRMPTAAAGALGPNQVLIHHAYSFPDFEHGLQVPARTQEFRNEHQDFAGWYIVTAQPEDPKDNEQPRHFSGGSTVDDIKDYMKSMNGNVVLTLQPAVAVVPPIWTPPVQPQILYPDQRILYPHPHADPPAEAPPAVATTISTQGQLPVAFARPVPPHAVQRSTQGQPPVAIATLVPN